MSLISGYWQTQGKRPTSKEENRILYAHPPEGDYCAVFETGSIVIVDIDDFNHHSGELDDPIRGNPRSEAVLQYLDKHGYKYNGIRTENGVHLEFAFPSKFNIDGNKNNWFSALGVKIEIKVTKPMELIRVNGIERKCFKGSIGSADIDELPPCLYPLQKSREKPFHMDFSTGSRNNSLSAYALHLPQCGIPAEEAVSIIRGINEFILDNPLPEDEIDLILREETVQKMQNNEIYQQERNLSHVEIGKSIIGTFNIVTFNGQMYRYKQGVYVPVDEGLIGSYIRRLHPIVKTSMKNETLDYIKDVTFREVLEEEKNLINIKNGLLEIKSDGSVQLLPHSKDVISFRQFNANYNPECESLVLHNTLNKFFDGNQELIDLFSEMMGYLMMNHSLYQKAFFFVGNPASGKSKVLDMIAAFCGKENVASLSLRDLDDRFRPANLFGKTVNINADLDKAKIQNTGNFKSLVTGDLILAEVKYGKPFSFANTCKLIYASNTYPDFSNDPEGVQRRLILFPCQHKFDRSDPDFNPHIDRDLQCPETLSALLNLSIRGYQKLIQNGGFSSNSATQSALEEFKCNQDSVYVWMKECDRDLEYLLVEPIKDGTNGSYMDYYAYCLSSGEVPKSQREFSKSICSEFGFATTAKRIKGTQSRAQFYIRKK